jgi:CHAD domain-containing protein
VEALGKAPSDEALHQVRIGAKRARYAAEAVAPVVGRPATRFAELVAELQSTLGEYNDAVITRDWLRDAVAEMPAATAFVAGALSERERGLARQARAEWPAVWKKLSRRKLHAWMER